MAQWQLGQEWGSGDVGTGTPSHHCSKEKAANVGLAGLPLGLAAPGFGFPASPSVFVYLWMRRMGLARLSRGVHEFTAQNKQHPTQLCASCRHLRGSWVGKGSVYLHTPESCWGQEGNPTLHLPAPRGWAVHVLVPQLQPPHPFPGVPWFVCPRSLYGHAVGQPGASCGHSVGTAAPGAVQGLGGLCWDWGELCRSCTGTMEELYWDHAGCAWGAAPTLGWGLS